MATKCPFCGTQVNEGAVVCTGCGAYWEKIPLGSMFGLVALLIIILGPVSVSMMAFGNSLAFGVGLSIAVGGGALVFMLAKQIRSRISKPIMVWKRRM